MNPASVGQAAPLLLPTLPTGFLSQSAFFSVLAEKLFAFPSARFLKLGRKVVRKTSQTQASRQIRI
jgi:hypothetical protein